MCPPQCPSRKASKRCPHIDWGREAAMPAQVLGRKWGQGAPGWLAAVPQTTDHSPQRKTPCRLFPVRPPLSVHRHTKNFLPIHAIHKKNGMGTFRRSQTLQLPMVFCLGCPVWELSRRQLSPTPVPCCPAALPWVDRGLRNGG